MFCRAACWRLGGRQQQEEKWAVCISCVADCPTHGMLWAAAQYRGGLLHMRAPVQACDRVWTDAACAVL